MPPSRRESRRERRKEQRAAKHVRSGRNVLIAGVVGFVVVIGTAGALVARSLSTLPSVTHIPPVSAAATLYDASGHEITQLNGFTDSSPVPLSQIPKNLQNALIATEDASFYTNPGFSLRGILRATLDDLTGRGTLQGASTISEQLGKMLFLHDNQSVNYKVKEILLGISLDRTYTKGQILDMYLNRVYLGAGAVGVGAASQVYFHKPVSQLDLAQCALLAGLPQAPSYFDPLVNPKAALARRNEVLARMAQTGYLTAADVAQAQKLPLELAPGAGSSSAAASSYPDPWFVDAVIAYLEQRGFTSNQLFSGDLKIYTTLSPKIQQAAQNAVNTVMGPLPQGPQAAEAVMNPGNGDVLALVGGRYHPPGYLTVENFATNGLFQTGSAIKPLAEYPTAIEHGDTAFTVVEDAPFLKHNGHFWPNNDNFIYQGRIPLEYALAISDNNASVRLELSNKVGIKAAWDTAVHQFGLPLDPADQTNAALGIGGLTRGVTPLEMVTAYSTYANHGVRPRPRIVTQVVSATGQVLFSDPVRATPEISPQVAYILTSMMQHVFTHPGATAQGEGIGRPAAGKTGTTSGGKDDWFCGFVPQLAACVWEGYPTPTPQPGVYGATYALPMWRITMEQSLAGVPAEPFIPPPGIVTRQVDTKSGMLPSPLTPKSYIATGSFIQGTQPTQVSNVWVDDRVVRGDAHLLWTPGCPYPSTTQIFLKKPTDLIPGAPLPADHTLWAPTRVCGNGTSASSGGQGPGVGSRAPGSTRPSSPTSPTSPSQTPPSSTTGQILNFTVSGGVLAPTEASVEAGVPVTVTIQNQDPTAYVFEDTGLGLLVNVLPSQTTTFSFTPPSPGTFPFLLVGGSTQGTLTVTSPSGIATGQGGKAASPTNQTPGQNATGLQNPPSQAKDALPSILHRLFGHSRGPNHG